ncbi:MAG: hypothetical protein IKH76_07830 [Clostridiales bacterium]|nr:hypothetical protein [Clostridiales bacterium]
MVKENKGKKTGILARIVLFGVIPAIVIAGIVVAVVFANGRIKEENLESESVGKIKTEVTVTYGTPITVDLFLNEGADPQGCSIASDISSINPDDIASYKITINSNGYKVKSTLNIVDDQAPTAEAVAQKIYLNQLPAPEDCVKNVEDKSDYKIYYAEDADFSKPGPCQIPVKIEDHYGNIADILCPFDIIDDHNGPVITGCEDITVVVFDVPSYREGITASDNYDPHPTLTVDNSEVNTEKVGTYPLRYIATDECGNQTTITVNVNVISKKKAKRIVSNGGKVKRSRTTSNWHKYDHATAADAYAAARKIYKAHCGGKTDVIRGMRIFRWINYNIAFSYARVTHSSWAAAACQAFGRRYTSCYGAWAASKALCDVAGIPNKKVWRRAGRHIWCLCKLNGEWYHCDATRYVRGRYSYMMTDREIRRAVGDHQGFNTSNLPKRATKSVQKYLNYGSATVKANFPYKKPKPTPTTKPSKPTAPAKPTKPAVHTTAPATHTPAPASKTAAPTTKTPPTEKPKPTADPTKTAEPTKEPTAAPPTEESKD